MNTVETFFEEYDLKNSFVWFRRKGINVSVSFYNKPFLDEMDYWGMHVTYKNKNGNAGFVFSKQVAEDKLSQVIRGYLDHSGLFLD